MKSFLTTIAVLTGLVLLGSLRGSAQLAAVRIGVDGLTCSQCTRNVELQLRRLPFVAAVAMNLEHTNGVIRLKEGTPFAPEQVAKAVRDAGFSLRYLALVVAHAGRYQTGGACFTVSGLGIQAADGVPEPLPDSLCLQLLGPPFAPRKGAAALPGRTCAGSRYFAAASCPEPLP